MVCPDFSKLYKGETERERAWGVGGRKRRRKDWEKEDRTSKTEVMEREGDGRGQRQMDRRGGGQVENEMELGMGGRKTWTLYNGADLLLPWPAEDFACLNVVLKPKRLVNPFLDLHGAPHG